MTWISHGCTCVPHPEPPSCLPPHPILRDHPSTLALSTLPHALNPDWRFKISFTSYSWSQVWACQSPILELPPPALPHQDWLWNGSQPPSQQLTLNLFHPESGCFECQSSCQFFPEKWTKDKNTVNMGLSPSLQNPTHPYSEIPYLLSEMFLQKQMFLFSAFIPEGGSSVFSYPPTFLSEPTWVETLKIVPKASVASQKLNNTGTSSALPFSEPPAYSPELCSSRTSLKHSLPNDHRMYYHTMVCSAVLPIFRSFVCVCMCVCVRVSHSVVSDSLWSHGL